MDPAAGWGFNLVHVHGFDPDSAQIENKMDQCNCGGPQALGVPLSCRGGPAEYSPQAKAWEQQYQSLLHLPYGPPIAGSGSDGDG